MAKKLASRAILLKPDQCRGCLTCQLRCSLSTYGEFSPAKANIMISRVKGGYGYLQSFKDKCDGCGNDYLCVQSCPYGTLHLQRR